MKPQQPLGQPINPNPGDPQYVPQPLDGRSPRLKPSKKLWLVIAGAVGLLLILGGLFWFLSKSAKSDYDKAVVTYKQQIKEVRDGMNTKLDEGNISIYDKEAPPIFEEYGKKMQDVTAKAPKAPKVLGIIPAGNANPEVATLTTAANNYAGELRHLYQLFKYYTGVAQSFKPIKDLGMFTALHAETVKGLPGMWETFLAEFKAIEPPAGLDSLKADLTSQAEVLLTKFKELADGFDQRTVKQNDDFIITLKEPTQAFNETFQKSSGDTSNESIDKVNAYYDELDNLLK